MSVFRLWCNGYWTRIIYWPKRGLKSLSAHWLHWWHLSQHELSHVKSMYCTFKLGGIQHTVSKRKIDHDFLYIISLFKIMTAASSVARMFSLLVNKNLLTNLSTNSIQGTLLLCPRVSLIEVLPCFFFFQKWS